MRILANRIERVSNGAINAQGGGTAPDGVIRIEAFIGAQDFPVNATNPVALRSGAPGPLVSPISQRVGITAVGGTTVSLQNNQPLNASPLGAFGEVDVTLQVPGPIVVNVQTEGVPAGTSVQVTAKDRRGGRLISGLAPLVSGNCSGAGVCAAATTLDLSAGTYVLEARATFQP